MCENNSYEPLAEVYIGLSDNFSEDIYCLCSRVVIRGTCCDSEDFVEEDCQKFDNTGEENIVRFFNSSTESPPPQIKAFRKREHEEVLSCYCSASHCSTDEHDSVRESALHSDSGADLSESSRDLDWDRYWSTHGERLVWESWIAKYGDYIDPNYANAQDPSSEETLFNVNPSNTELSRKTTFSGVLDAINEMNENGSAENVNIAGENQVQTDIVPYEPLPERSFRSDSSSLGEDELIRLSTSSSGKSSSPTATTDSMTSVTHMTISSSELSFGIEECSLKSGSILSSSDSLSSHEQQWQQLWNDHCNEQYQLCYRTFVSKFDIPTEDFTISEQKDDLGESFKRSKVDESENDNQNYSGLADLFRENVDQMQVDNTEVIIKISKSEKNLKRKEVRAEKKKNQDSENRTEGKRNQDSRKKLSSVGHLLKCLNSLSVDQELDETSIPLDEMNGNNGIGNQICDKLEDAPQSNCLLNEESEKHNSIGQNFKDKKDMDVEFDNSKELDSMDAEKKLKNKTKKSKTKSNKEVNVDEKSMEDSTSPQEQGAENPVVSGRSKNKLKRVHGGDADDSSIDRMKGAFSLMGFVFKPNKDNGTAGKHFKRAEVVYRKRNIRSHNRALKLLQPRHIYFTDEGEVKNAVLEKVKKFLETENALSSSIEPVVENPPSEVQLRPVEEDNYSEKDDSTDKESFYSAEEDAREEETMENSRQDRKENITKLQKKKRKKKMRKNNLPNEIVENEKLLKYWYNRYRLFSKFDFGIRLDAESWYSVTPEKVSKHIAERCRCDVIIDAFCGAGGNAIQFAFTCERVIAIDIDPLKIELAKHNAGVYGVHDRIEFIVGDFLQLAKSLKGDVVFLSPPWGGPHYMFKDVFCLEDILPPAGGEEVFRLANAISPNLAYYLPKNINTDELVKVTGPGGAVEIEQNFLEKKLIAVTAYFGELVDSHSNEFGD